MKKKDFLKLVDDAIKNDNEQIFFELMKNKSVDEKYEFLDKAYKNKDSNIFPKLIKDIIDNEHNLSGYKITDLRNYCLNNTSISLLDDIGLYYCSKKNDIYDMFSLLQSKVIASFSYPAIETLSDLEKEININKFFSFLESNQANKKDLNPTLYDPILYFSNSINVNKILYLDDSNAKKISNIIPELHVNNVVNIVIDNIHSNNAVYENSFDLNYYLKKQPKNLKIEVPFNVYLDLDQKKFNFDLTKFSIDKESKFSLTDFYLLLCSHNFDKNKMISLLANDKVVNNFFKVPGNKFITHEKDNFLNMLMLHLNKEQINNLFKKSNCFELSNNQKLVINDYLSNHGEHIIYGLNTEFQNTTNISSDAVEKYVSTNIDDNNFVSQLNNKAKNLILKHYMDYSKIQDENNFIDNFLKNLPKNDSQCEYLFFNFDATKNNEQIKKYVFNEKNSSSSFGIHGCIKFFHFLNNVKKDEVVKSLFVNKNERKDFVSYYEHMINHPTFTDQETDNLQELKSLYDGFISKKENELPEKNTVKKKITARK